MRIRNTYVLLILENGAVFLIYRQFLRYSLRKRTTEAVVARAKSVTTTYFLWELRR